MHRYTRVRSRSARAASCAVLESGTSHTPSTSGSRRSCERTVVEKSRALGGRVILHMPDAFQQRLLLQLHRNHARRVGVVHLQDRQERRGPAAIGAPASSTTPLRTSSG